MFIVRPAAGVVLVVPGGGAVMFPVALVRADGVSPALLGSSWLRCNSLQPEDLRILFGLRARALVYVRYIHALYRCVT